MQRNVEGSLQGSGFGSSLAGLKELELPVPQFVP